MRQKSVRRGNTGGSKGLFFRGGRGKEKNNLLESSQASPARPSERNIINVKTLECRKLV